ncbi:LAFA_0G08350g1_1 [Lachancea sp. 'fantastica']|nr:LAFA_0G08350g1_1 [Lachancea sp. 'fantastica']
MTTFPGDNTNIPKRLSECLEFQPLNYLVPKSGLCDLMRSSLHIRPHYDKIAFGEHSTSDVSRKAKVGPDGPFELKQGIRLHFKDIEITESGAENVPGDLLEGLSDEARLFLNTACLEECGKRPHSSDEEEGKKLLENQEGGSGAGLSSVELRTSAKKSKIPSQTVVVDQNALHGHYVKELNDIVTVLDTAENSDNAGNFICWTRLVQGRTLSDVLLERIEIIMKQLSKTEELKRNFDSQSLSKLLKACSESIETILKTEDFSSLTKGAFRCVSIILSIFVLDLEDKRLYLERYLVSTITFLQRVNEELSEGSTSSIATADNCLLLKSSLSLLSVYVAKKSLQEEDLITKLVYLLCDLLTFSPIQIQGMARLSTWLESLKRESSAGLISLFKKLPTQRHFIIDELLYRLDTLPTNRVHKKLQKLDDSVYASHLFATLTKMLQSIDSRDIRPKEDNITEEAIVEFLKSFKEQQLQLSSLIDHINRSVINRSFAANTTKKFILDNYVQDLISMVFHPRWSMAENLLASLLRMMLLVFSPSNRDHSIKEASILSVVTGIGTAMQEIRLKGRVTGKLTLAAIHESPELLETVLSHFRHCMSSLSSKGEEAGNLWDRMMAFLLSLSEAEEDGSLLVKMTNEAIAAALRDDTNCGHDNQIKQSFQETKDSEIHYFGILQASELANLFDPYIKLILSLLDKQKTKVMSGAIKCLSPLIARDPDLLAVPSVGKVLEQKLIGSSASVKSAILDLIGSIHYTKFYRLINLNFNDESTLVRKQVLNLNLKIYDTANDVGVKAFVANKILRRAEDEEDSIVEKARTALLERWFIPQPQQAPITENESKDLKDVVQIITTLVGAEEGSQPFDFFLNDYVLNKELHETEEFERILHSTRLITCRLVDDAIDSHYSNDQKSHSQALNIFHLLSIVAACDYPFITKDHVTTLYPYLLSSERSELQFYILKVFRIGFSKLSYFKPGFLAELETVILGRLPKMSVTEMEEAIPLCWSIAGHRKDDTRICQACSSCLALLSPYINSLRRSPASVKADGKLQRLLYLAAGFARFCHFTNTPDKFPHLKTREPVYEYVTKCLLAFSMREVAPDLRRIALRNLLKVSTSHPKIFNSAKVLGVLDEELASKSLETSLVVIQCFCDFFINEERKSLNLTRPERYSILKHQRNRSHDAETSSDAISAAVATRYLRSVLEISLLEETYRSCVGLKYIELVIEFGYSNPAKCIPTIMALSGSPHENTRRQALAIMDSALAKNTSMLFSNLSSGIKSATDHGKWLRETGLSTQSLFLPGIQNSLLNAGMKQTRFFNSIKKVFSSYLMTSKGAFSKEHILIICSNLAALTFESLLDVSILVRFLDAKTEEVSGIVERHQGRDNLKSKALISDLVLARECILHLRAYLCQKYGVTDENVAAVGTYEEEELRAKAAESKKPDIQFAFPPSGFDKNKVRNQSYSYDR